ncbi:PAS domain S-box protein [Methanoregula formicica]|uniref:histidine kinase n=1 Tax=Methanoregula formicica (strain DSM 22288 / NBRC 105244 / SMSP) TaxID=593750 RepID=L0HED2_METFS|nr:PAS domain S-box protein [Methanoregula formicica]AGB01459.1 PAS domain S-box [Methanoregula formicica SMSP]
MTSDLIFDLLIVMLFISGVSMAAVGWYTRRFVGRVPAAAPFVLLMLCAAAWAFLYILDLLTMSLPLRIFYHNLRFLYLPFISVLELWLVLAYVNRTEWIRRDLAAIVLIIPVLSALLAVTSPFHTFFRYNFSINTAGPVPVLVYSESFFYQIYFLYSFVLLAIAIILLIHETRKRGTLWETSTILLLIALTFPTVLDYFAETTRFPFPGVNPTPALLWIAAILYAIALFRYHFLDIIPIARGRLIEALSKPVLVLDTADRVIDINPAACSLFSLTPAAALGKTIEEIVPDWPDFLSLCREKTTMKKDLVRTRNKEVFHYIGSVEPLLGINGVPEGHLVFLQDITDLKRAQEALREKTEELDQYFSTSLDLFCIADSQGYFRRLNPEWEKTLGYSLGDLEGRRFLDFVHPDDVPATLDAISTLSAQKEVLNFTNRYRHRDGSYRWIEWRSFPKGDRIFAAARDITKRRLAEQQLADHTRFLSTLIDTLPLPLFYKDAGGKYLGCNRPFEEYLGIGRSALIGKTVYDIAPKELADVYFAADLELLKNNGFQTYEAQVRYADGSLHDVIYYKACYLDHRGATGGIIGAFLDITERKRMESALRESEEKYRTIIEEMQDLFYRTDISGKITMLSPSAFTISGYTRDELIGQDVARVYADPHDREKLLTILKEKGSVDSFALDLKVRDGSIRHVTTSSHFYRDADGNVLGVEGVIHDITEQRRAEEALRIANKKLHLMSSITRHDIRNQLMALMAFIELSKDSIDKPEELIGFLKKNQKIAETITRQITFTKDYEDLGLNAPLWQDVNASIDAAVALLPMRNIRVDKEVTGLEVFADPLAEKVFYNLIDNSLRYGGEKMTTIRVTSRVEGPLLVLVYEDDGGGIPEWDKKVIFDKGVGKNTGLGLYLSREILAITGIGIIENGVPGEGARFEMVVPKDGYRFIS